MSKSFFMKIFDTTAFKITIPVLFTISQILILHEFYKIEPLIFYFYLGLLVFYSPYIISFYIFWTCELYNDLPLIRSSFSDLQKKTITDKENIQSILNPSFIQKVTKDNYIYNKIGKICNTTINIYHHFVFVLAFIPLVLHVWIIIWLVNLFWGTGIGGADIRGGAGISFDDDDDFLFDSSDKPV